MDRIPYLKTDNQTIDDAFRIAYGDLTGNIRFFKDDLLAQERLVILAGLAYDTPWTGDASINIWNGGGLLYPEVAKNTLLSVLYDDNGTIRAGGQYWDAIIWAIGAWSYYIYTGDEAFLEYAYSIVKNSLAFFEDTEFNEELNLFRGGSCYGDGIAETQYVTENGIACLWPCFDRCRQFAEHEYGRHSGTVWPHIQGFWADAAASNGRADLFRKELMKLAENAVRNSFFSEIYHPTNGTPYGGLQEDEGKGIRKRFPSYPRQTWSATAYIRMVLFGLVGMQFAEDGVRFVPIVLDDVKQITVKNITYRKMVLNLSIAMTGDRIQRFVVNGVEQKDPFIPCNMEGEVDVVIE